MVDPEFFAVTVVLGGFVCFPYVALGAMVLAGVALFQYGMILPSFSQLLLGTILLVAVLYVIGFLWRRPLIYKTNIPDEDLFRMSQLEDCPICFVPLPTKDTGSKYQSCCGKIICSGCSHAMTKLAKDEDDELCAFCRTQMPTSTEILFERMKVRVGMEDPFAVYTMGCCYSEGDGFPQSHSKAIKLYHHAANLGLTGAYCNIGKAYLNGNGVKKDKKKAVQYYERAAIDGDTIARGMLGHFEERAGNIERAAKHYMIAVGLGNDESLKKIRDIFMKGYLTKDVYARALQSYQAYIDEVRTDQRDEAGGCY